MRIGIFGGTFDPPHLGHLILAQESQIQLQLDRLLFVLTPNPPHKRRQVITPVEHRLALLQAALKGNNDFEISRIDLDRPVPHYTVDTVALLAQANPQAELVYLMGGDSLRDLPTWYKPLEFLKYCAALGVMRRPRTRIDMDTLEQVLPGIREKVCWVQAPMLEIAASQIRKRARQGKPFRYFVMPAVYDLIVARNLYAPAHPH